MFLKIKKIPRVNWSSDKPYNFKPKFSTFFFLCFGLMLFGLGEGLLIVSFTGASPWSVLAQGISLNVSLSIGTITFLISVAVLILWIPLEQKPGMGTILNAIIIALMIDFCIKFVPTPSNYLYQLILAIISVIMVGIGGGIYLVSNLGAGPRDGLMIGLQKNKLTSCCCKSIFGDFCCKYWMVLGWNCGIGNLIICFWNRSLYCFRFIFS